MVVRPIEPGDASRLVAFHDGLSFQTIYRRFFGVHPHLQAAEVEHFCSVDQDGRLALVALVDDEIVAVARMEKLDSSSAEVAFVVADRCQHRGLGRLMAQRLAVAARERGVERFVAEVLPENTPMLHLLTDAGFDVIFSRSDGIVHVSCPII